MKGTDRMNPRPVWARREQRLTLGIPPEPPTEAEIIDAFRVLEQGIQWPLSLYAEAEAIVWEASEERAIGLAELQAALGPDSIPFEDLYPAPR